MVTQATHLARSTGTNYTLTRATGTEYTLVQSTPTYANYLDALLAESVWWIDAHQATSSETIPNLGTGGTALDALNGGGTAITTNDAKWLEYDPADGAYVYLPGGANTLTVPDEAALDITGDIDIRVRLALDDWTAGTDRAFLSKFTGSGAYSYEFSMASTDRLRFFWSVDGTAQLNETCSAALTVADGETLWVRVTMDVDTGASNYAVTFYQSSDGSTWDQVGNVESGAAATSIFAGAADVHVMARTTSGTRSSTGSLYRAIVKDGIDGTTVLDVDTSVLTDGSATSFTATTGQTVTINRATSGRKSTVVHGGAGGGSLWLLGTDDYLEVADNDLLDFGASDSFTVLAVVRQWATPVTARFYVRKGLYASGARWGIGNNSTSLVPRAQISDGTNSVASTGATYTSGDYFSIAAVMDRASNIMTLYRNGASADFDSIAAVGDATNAQPLRVGANADGSYQDFEFTAALIWRRALTAAEITALSNYFTTRTHAE